MSLFRFCIKCHLPSLIASFMIFSPLGMSSVQALNSILMAEAESSHDPEPHMSWKSFIFSFRRARIWSSFLWSMAERRTERGKLNTQGLKQSLKKKRMKLALCLVIITMKFQTTTVFLLTSHLFRFGLQQLFIFLRLTRDAFVIVLFSVKPQSICKNSIQTCSIPLAVFSHCNFSIHKHAAIHLSNSLKLFFCKC